MVKITGGREFGQRLRIMGGPNARKKVRQALFAAGERVANEAGLSITRGAVSGKSHVPSKPGEPPNADTHVLDRSIEAAMVSDTTVQVSANAPYAVALEYGTSKMAARPFMRPAVRNTEDDRQQLWARLAVSLAKDGNGA